MNNLHDLADQLCDAIQRELEKTDEIENRRKLFDEEGRQLKIKQDKLVADQLKLHSDTEKLEQEKQFVVIALKKLQEQEAIEKLLENKRAVLKSKEEELILEEDRLKQKEKSIELQKTELSSLKQKEELLKMKETTLIKREQIADKRKEEMDIQQQFLDSEKIRLKKLAESWNR